MAIRSILGKTTMACMLDKTIFCHFYLINCVIIFHYINGATHTRTIDIKCTFLEENITETQNCDLYMSRNEDKLQFVLY